MMTARVRQPRILVAQHSSEGQTAKIADVITQELRQAGADVDLQPVLLASSPAGYDAVVLGDSIHMSRHSQPMIEYLRRYAEALDAVPAALFQVSITSIGTDTEHAAKAQTMVDTLLDETGFHPDAVGLFAGALAYSRYGWVKRRMIRAIAKKGGLDTDITRDREYTDWAAVRRFAHTVHALATAGNPEFASIDKEQQ